MIGFLGKALGWFRPRASSRASAWLPWSVFALSLIFTALGFVLLALNRYHLGAPDFDFAFRSTVIVVSCSTVGVFLMAGGSRGRGAVRRLRLGSVSTKVLHVAQVPF